MRITYVGDVYMTPAYDTHAPKKPTNVSVNSDLLVKAKALKKLAKNQWQERRIQFGIDQHRH